MFNDVAQHRRLDLIIRKPIYFLFLIFVFFPYISIVNLGTDMQPYALVMSFVILFLFKKNFTFSQVIIAFVFLFSIIILVISGFNFTSLRSFFNYASLFFVSYASYHVLKTERLNFEIFLKSSIIIWFIVGLLQTIYDKTFLNFIISASRTTENRGVTGLAPEPTFYGIVFIFFLLFLLHTNYNNKKFFMMTCVIGVVILAKSAMAFLMLAVMLFFFLITHASLKYILLSIILVLVVPFAIVNLMPESRLSFLVSKIYEEPTSLVLVDASINDRFFHVFFALKGFFNNFLLPNGFLSWNGYVSSQLGQYSDLVIIEWFSVGGRIMSGYGAAFFELGIIAVFVPLALFSMLFSIYRNNLKKFFFFFLFVNTIMFSAIPIGFSFFSFYLGFLGYLVSRKRRGFVHDD